MTAKELRLDVEGIKVTSFEGPRRLMPESARQQCHCGNACYSDCLGNCGTACESDCMNQCGNNGDAQATLENNPRAVGTSVLMNSNNHFNIAYEVSF
jgi:hypothetical protein